MKTACPRIKQELRQTLSRDTLKRLLTQAGYTWKRVRRSLRTLRNEQDFRTAQQELAKLRAACADSDDDFDDAVEFISDVEKLDQTIALKD